MRRRRLLLLLLDRDRVRFLAMSLAGLLLIGLTATAERGAAVMGLAYVLGAPRPAEVSVPPVTSIDISLPSPSPEPSATTTPTASPWAGGIPARRTPSPAGVMPPSGSDAPSATDPPTTSGPPASAPPASAIPPPTAPPPPDPGAPPPTQTQPSASPSPIASPTASASPTPTAAPLAIGVTTGATPYLFQVSGIVPGDTWTRDATVTNPGAVSFRYVFELTQSASTLLWNDPDGLHVEVSSGGTVLYDGLASAMGQISAPNTVVPGASDVLHFVFRLPASADNRFQGLSQEIAVVFTATQTP